MDWISTVVADFFCAHDFIDNFIQAGTFIVAIWGVTKAINAFKSYDEKRDDAIWNFYTGLSTFLYRLKLTIGETGNPKPVTNYFYKKIKPDAPMHIKEIETFQKLAADFLHYLSTGNGQVPPSPDFDSWQKMRFVLVNFLNSAQFLGLRHDFTEDEFEVSLNEIHVIIDEMNQRIKERMEKLKNDLLKTSSTKN